MVAILAAVDVAEARAELHTVLVGALAGLLPAARVWARPPDQVAAPTVYLDVTPRLDPDPTVGLLVEAGFGVVIVVDGAEQAAIDLMDRAAWALWAALPAVGVRVAGGDAEFLDAGGPTLRAYRLTAIVTLPAPCP